MPSPLLLLALPVLMARDAPVGTISGPRDMPGRPVILSMGLQGGPGFLAGANGNAYGAALNLGLNLDLHLSPLSALSLEMDHTLFPVVRGGGLLDEPQHLPPDGTFSGSQRHYNGDLGFRLGFPVIDVNQVRSDQVYAIPWVRLAAGATFTDTRVDVPSFDGQTRIRTRQGQATLAPGLGVAIHVRRPLTIQPSFKAVGLLALDHDEYDNSDALRSTWRLLPALHVLYNL